MLVSVIGSVWVVEMVFVSKVSILLIYDASNSLCIFIICVRCGNLLLWGFSQQPEFTISTNNEIARTIYNWNFRTSSSIEIVCRKNKCSLSSTYDITDIKCTPFIPIYEFWACMFGHNWNLFKKTNYTSSLLFCFQHIVLFFILINAMVTPPPKFFFSLPERKETGWATYCVTCSIFSVLC